MATGPPHGVAHRSSVSLSVSDNTGAVQLLAVPVSVTHCSVCLLGQTAVLALDPGI